MQKNTITFILLFCCYLISSCEKPFLLYTEKEPNVSGIYFYSVSSYTNGNVPSSYVDSVTYSFQNDPDSIRDRIIALPIRTLGNTSDHDRYFKAKVVGGTAIPGVDFEELKDIYTIPAGRSTSSLLVRLKRSPSLLSKALTIDIQLQETEDFKILLPNLINIGNKKVMDASKFRINFSEIITEPSYYTTWGNGYFGIWSAKKFKLLNQLMGWTNDDWRFAGYSGYPVSLGKFAYAATLFKAYLEKNITENTPIYEDDAKTFMQLGPSYLVDYSGL